MQVANHTSSSNLIPSSKSIQRSPSYLYKKENIFYFRYKFSSKEKEHFQHSEIRISLQTGFVHIAKKLARQLRSKLEGFIMQNKEEMSYTELKKYLTLKLKELMASCPEKNPPSIAEIKNRMDLFRQKLLNSADKNLYQPEEGFAINDNKFIKISVKETLDQSLFLQKLALNTPSSLLNMHFPITIISLLKEKVFTLDELTEDNILTIINEYHKMQISLNRILYERENGNFAYERQFLPANTQTPTLENFLNNSKPILLETPPSPTLNDALDNYINIKKRENTWSSRTEKEFISKLNFFAEQLGNIPITSITKHHIREFKNTTEKLPVGYSAKYKTHSLEEIKQGIIPQEDKITPKTLSKHYGIINGFLNWLHINYDDINSELSKILKINLSSKKTRQREIFNTDDLQKIFLSHKDKEKSFNANYKYWVPLIGYYTGMRLEEICQLYLQDIKQEEGIWFFNLAQSEDKHLKTSAAIRQVPIHPDLIEHFDFLSFIEKQKKDQSMRLFPELKKQNDRYSHYVSRWFGKYLKDTYVKTDDNFKDFHSFRHTFIHSCKLENVDEYKVKEVVGHETSSKNITYGRYGKKYGLTILYNDVIIKIPSLIPIITK